MFPQGNLLVLQTQTDISHFLSQLITSIAEQTWDLQLAFLHPLVFDVLV